MGQRQHHESADGSGRLLIINSFMMLQLLLDPIKHHSFYIRKLFFQTPLISGKLLVRQQIPGPQASPFSKIPRNSSPLLMYRVPRPCFTVPWHSPSYFTLSSHTLYHQFSAIKFRLVQGSPTLIFLGLGLVIWKTPSTGSIVDWESLLIVLAVKSIMLEFRTVWLNLSDYRLQLLMLRSLQESLEGFKVNEQPLEEQRSMVYLSLDLLSLFFKRIFFLPFVSQELI